MGRQNPMLSHSSSRSSPSLRSVASSAVSSVKSATKVAKSVTKSFKNIIKKGAATAFRPLKKARGVQNLFVQRSFVCTPVILFVECDGPLIVLLGGNESDDDHPSVHRHQASKTISKEDLEEESETDEQEAQYVHVFLIFGVYF